MSRARKPTVFFKPDADFLPLDDKTESGSEGTDSEGELESTDLDFIESDAEIQLMEELRRLIQSWRKSPEAADQFKALALAIVVDLVNAKK